MAPLPLPHSRSSHSQLLFVALWGWQGFPCSVPVGLFGGSPQEGLELYLASQMKTRLEKNGSEMKRLYIIGGTNVCVVVLIVVFLVSFSVVPG